jgi:uncharacterized protein (DUF1778 family)
VATIGPPKRRKPVRKEESVHIRLTVEQKEGLTAAAVAAGLGLGPWLLSLGLKEMREMQRAEGGK